ncbi:MAG: DUF2442 domain-containing protein [Bosea sp. (in: a-proteobacteria)]
MAKIADADIAAAERRGQLVLETEPRASSASYDPATGRIVLNLVTGCSYAFPVNLVQELQQARPDDFAVISVDGLGLNLHIPALDTDLYVPALVAGIFGTRDWMSRELARRAGQVSSPAKAAAARVNGLKGGRPRKVAGG